MKKSFIRNIFLQISAIICSFFLISSTGCEPTDPVKVVIHTDFGDMIIELSDSTPGHRDNFIKLANEGFYDSLLFHRVMEGFMIQGGDPESKNALPGQRLGSGGPGYTIPAEMRADHLHVKGALAAARQGDSSNPTRASSGSQFYIVHGKTFTGEELDNIIERSSHMTIAGFEYTDEQKELYSTLGGAPFLDMNYTVFGQVIEGLDVIDSIASVRTEGKRTASVRHILLKADNASDPAEMAALNAQANELMEAIQGGSDFCELVTLYSKDPGSVKNCGAYIDFPEGQMVPAFNDFSFNEEVGALGAVNTRFGVHIIEVLNHGHKSTTNRPVEDVRFSVEILQ